MNLILATPLALRLAVLFLFGTVVGCLLNVAIYQLAWNRRTYSPWHGPADGKSRRHWSHFLPIVGWWLRRREATSDGSLPWRRSLVVELFTGLMFASLYWWEAVRLGLIIPPNQFGAINIPADWVYQAHVEYLMHVVLCSLMLVASLIDVDETTIPDAVTVPGTLFGLLMVTLLPQGLLPEIAVNVVGPRVLRPVWLSAPNDWPVVLGPATKWASLAVAMFCLWLWCVGLLPRHWRGRRGWRIAWAIFIRRIVEDRFSYAVVLMGAVVSAGVVIIWWSGGPSFQALLTALVGMAAGGGLVWSVRVIGTAVLRREAMGFGDVTLMAMIGVYLGWQACVLAFFLAPFFALLIALGQWLAHRENEIYFGPFLCLAAATVIVRWLDVWGWAAPIFRMSGLVPAVVVGCVLLLGLMLAIWQSVRWLFTNRS